MAALAPYCSRGIARTGGGLKGSPRVPFGGWTRHFEHREMRICLRAGGVIVNGGVVVVSSCGFGLVVGGGSWMFGELEREKSDATREGQEQQVDWDLRGKAFRLHLPFKLMADALALRCQTNSPLAPRKDAISSPGFISWSS